MKELHTNKRAKVTMFDQLPDNIIDQIKISNLFIDKISVTINVEKDLQDSLQRTLIMIGEDQSTLTSNKYYHTNIEIPIEGGSPLIIQAGPKKHKSSFLRFEWNPNKTNPLGQSEAVMWIDSLVPFGYSDLLVNGVVTRVDIAVDIHGEIRDQLMVTCSGLRKSRCWNSSNGTTETEYLGSSKGRRQIAIYNKSLQLGSAAPCVRIEPRIKPRCSIIELMDIKNPFAGVVLSRIEIAEALLKQHALLHFMDSCRYRGLHGALQIFPKQTRMRVRNKIKSVQPDYWNPEKLWDSWPSALDILLNAEACHTTH